MATIKEDNYLEEEKKMYKDFEVRFKKMLPAIVQLAEEKRIKTFECPKCWDIMFEKKGLFSNKLKCECGYSIKIK